MFGRKKTFASVASTFVKVQEDLDEVAEAANIEVGVLEVQREEINRQIQENISESVKARRLSNKIFKLLH